MGGWGRSGRRLRAVHAHVPVQVAALREAQQAQLALVGLLAAVDPQVLREGAAVREGLLAQPAPGLNAL